MKKLSKALSVIIALLLCLTVVLAACDQPEPLKLDKEKIRLVVGNSATLTVTNADGGTVVWASKDDGIATVSEEGVVTGVKVGTTSVTATVGERSATCQVVVAEETYADFEDYQAYMAYDLTALAATIGAIDTQTDAAVATALQNGIDAINAADTITAVKAAFNTAKTNIANCIPMANGIKSLTALSMDEKTEILGKLEDYAVRNGITGIPMFENGGYQMFNPRVTLGTENYIVGYGFGTLAEGKITADLDSENNTAWKRYYHTILAANPNTLLYQDSDDSNVSTVYGYIGAGYYTNFMNETKDGYEWVPELAAGEMEAVGGLDANGQADTWRFEIRSGLKYDTLGKWASKYAGREVQPEDFLTIYKLMFNQANGWFRGSEAAGQSGASYIVGSKEYYAATKNSPKGVDNSVDFSNFGVQIVTENDKNYLQIKLGAKVTPFYARYYTSSSLYMPVPEEFITDIGGVENYLGYNSDKSSTPADNSLSLGAYTVERFDEGQIVYKKNPYYVYKDTKYSIEGIHINILTAAATDNEAGFKEFLAGKTDASGIPANYLSQYKSDPRTRSTLGDFVYKLNVNTLDAAAWEYMFGENGVISQTPKDQYYQVKPIMSNEYFIRGLTSAFNRVEFADTKGFIASANFFSSDYLSDPENGVSYNSTDAHKNALWSIVNEDTDAYGYSVALARDYFRMALDELEAEGLMTPGTKENPTKIELVCTFYFASFEESMFKPLKQYWEEAFNDDSVSGGKYKIEFKFYAPSTTDMAYNDMKAGRYDIGFGGITGNPLNPLDFFSTLSSTPTVSSGWTLNWGLDTSKVDSDILVYNGERWSFDALQQATQKEVIVQDGELAVLYSQGDSDIAPSTDGKTVTLKLNYNKALNVQIDTEKIDLVIFGTSNDQYSDYNEWSILDVEGVTVDITDDGEGTITIVVYLPDGEIAKVPSGYAQGIDVYFDYTCGTVEGSELISYMFDFTK